MPKRPAEQFYPGDWLKDPAVRLCCPATRGIWIDLLAYMWADGTASISGTVEALARACSATTDEMVYALQELDQQGTALVNPSVTPSVTRNGLSQTNNSVVTVTCRRLLARENSNKSNALRQRRHREKRRSNEKVTPSRARSSSSSASTTTTSTPSISPPTLQEPLKSFAETDLPRLIAERLPQTKHQSDKLLDVLDKLVRIDGFSAPDVVATLRWWLESEDQEAAWWRENGCKSALTLRKSKDGNPHKFAQMNDKRSKGNAQSRGIGPVSDFDDEQEVLKWT